MSDDRYRDRYYRDQQGQRQPDLRQQGGAWTEQERRTGYSDPAYDTPYRSQRPTDDFGNRNPRRDYDPYAAAYGGGMGGYDSDRGYGRSYADSYGRDDDRGFFDKAGDEVKSWFGDEAAHARREEDHRGKGPRGYVRSDARILDDVNDRLADDRWVDPTDVEVQVKDAEVTLTGTVRSREQKRRAEDCAEAVSGVKHVQNNLRVADRDTTIL